MNRRTVKNNAANAEWVDPYEFLVTIKKEPTLSVLALADLELSDQTIESTSKALDNYLANIFEVIKDKLISITSPPQIIDDNNIDNNTNTNNHTSPNKTHHNSNSNSNQYRPIISKDDLNQTFDKIKLDIVSYTLDLLNDRFRSDRFTLLNYKKKIAEQIETNRNAAQQFRKDYDISARNRHEESIRVLQQYETEKYTEETSRLRKVIKDLELGQAALLKKVTGLEDDKTSLSKSLDGANASIFKLGNELKAMKDAKRKQHRGNDHFRQSFSEHEGGSHSPVSTPGISERRSSMASRSSKDLTSVTLSPPSSPSSPVAKFMPQICQKCIVYEEDIKNLKTIVIQLTNVNSSMLVDTRPDDDDEVLYLNSRPQTSQSSGALVVKTEEALIDDSRPLTPMPINAGTASTNISPMLPAPAVEPIAAPQMEISQQDKHHPDASLDEPIKHNEEQVVVLPKNNTEAINDNPITVTENSPIIDSIESIEISMTKNIDDVPMEATIISSNVITSDVAQPGSNSIDIEPISEVIDQEREKIVDNDKPKTKDKKKSKQSQSSNKEVVTIISEINQEGGGYLGFGPTSKDLKKGEIIPKKVENISSIGSIESDYGMRPSSSMSDYGLRPSTTLSDMSRDDRIADDLYDLSKGRGLASMIALQRINRKNEIIIQEQMTKMLSLEYQIRNLSKRIRSDEVFMEKLDYLNALKLQERDVLLTAVCNQLKKIKEEKESENRLKKFAKADMPLQIAKPIIQSKKTLPLPNIKFDIPPERESSPQSNHNKLVLSSSMPNLPYSRYLESLQPTTIDKNIVSNNPTSSSNKGNSLKILEDESSRHTINNNQDKRPRIPITDELYGDEGIEKLLKSDPDALYEYRNIRKQILNLVVEHTSTSKPKKKAIDISLRKKFKV